MAITSTALPKCLVNIVHVTQVRVKSIKWHLTSEVGLYEVAVSLVPDFSFLRVKKKKKRFHES